MSSEDDKTKIKSAEKKPVVSDDVTRIAPSSKIPAASDDNDKTRIATPSSNIDITENLDADKTRVAGSAKKQLPTDDATRINLNTNANANINKASSSDATQFRPPTRPIPDPDQNSGVDFSNGSQGAAGSDNVELGEHGTLKQRFVLEKVLGVGGMGIVYKAKDLLKVEAHDRDPYVAIKVLSDEFKAHPEAFISLQRESRKSQRIAHPNIVNVHDFDRDDDTVFMTMEFLDGSPLDQLIRQYKSTGLPTDYAWDIIKGMSAALSHAHAEKIIHSDFKPGNVFVTKKGLAKVFDFGIARAVAKVEHLEDNPEDRTIFDAGNLGALTPAYASLEMLEGKEPDIRDDIYALGCVAYELFSGEHPYNKVPADEAARQGLKPKRLTNVNKAQWRAIEKAIAFKREDRIASVDDFVVAISPKLKKSNWIMTSLALLLSVVITSYFLFFQEKEIDPYSEFDIRNELELEIKIDFYKKDLDSLIADPTFTERWQELIWKDVSDLTILTKGGAPWLDEKKKIIYQLYMNEISSAMKDYKYAKATAFIDNAKRYTDDTSELDAKSKEIVAQIALNKSRKAERDTQRKKDLVVQKKQQPVVDKPIVNKQSSATRFDVALANVNDQLKCQGGRINMRDFETAINKLRELDRTRYRKLETKVVDSLAACIVQLGKTFPARAVEAKKQSLRIFTSNRVLANIKIDAKDPCDQSLAGLGSRGKRAVCKDKIKNAGSGPDLVVIPGNSRNKVFAIGKYEVSVADFNKYCKATSACSTIKNKDSELPASDMSFSLVKGYLKWISKQTGQKYRLPTKNEWTYAAKASRKRLDANRNCKLSTRGIEKGEELVKASIGKQNSWGLVNYVGNVQEWVYDQGRKLVAVGGSYNQSMDNCDINTTNSHDGSADKSTGFRVMRELRGV